MVTDHSDLAATRTANLGPERIDLAARAEPLVPIFAHSAIGAGLDGVVVVIGYATETYAQRYSALRYRSRSCRRCSDNEPRSLKRKPVDSTVSGARFRPPRPSSLINT